LNEEKLCQLLANQTRALQKRQPQAASHAHHLQTKPPQKLATQRVPVTAVQVQTLSHAKTVAEAVQNSAPRQLMLHANHAQRVRSLKSVHLRLMAHRSALTAGTATIVHHAATVQLMATAMIELHAKTAAATRAVQSVRLTIAMIVHHAATARLMATATTLVVQSVQTTVVATGLRKVATAGFQIMSVAISETKVQVVQLKRLGVHAMIAMRVRHMETAMTATLVTHVLLTATAMQIARHALLAIAKIARLVQVLALASATATAQSALRTASQILHALKTALQSAVGQKIAVVTQVARSAIRKVATAGFPRARAITIRETPTVLTAQHAMIHANQLSVAHATLTQTRRLSSKTKFLSV
jgi:hypothetical protein